MGVESVACLECDVREQLASLPSIIARPWNGVRSGKAASTLPADLLVQEAKFFPSQIYTIFTAIESHPLQSRAHPREPGTST